MPRSLWRLLIFYPDHTIEVSRAHLWYAYCLWGWSWVGTRFCQATSRGIQFQWGLCSPNDSLHWVCSRFSFKHSLVSATLGIKVWSAMSFSHCLGSLFYRLFFILGWYFFTPLCSLAHSELSTVFYEKVLLLAWGWVWFITFN